MVAVTDKKTRLIELYHLLSYDEVDSTNEEAKRLARGGGAEGAVLWARRQTGGRGRMGREWISQDGNLFVSILLRPQKPLAQWPQLSFVTALAAHDAILPMLEAKTELSLKWPNDILLNRKKTGGILLEAFDDDEQAQWLVIGLGVNIEHAPANVAFPATCLKENGIEIVSAKIVLSRFLSCFMERYDRWAEDGFAEMAREWQAHAFLLGEEVEINASGNVVRGTFKGIDTAGHMLLEQNGIVIPVTAGDFVSQ